MTKPIILASASPRRKDIFDMMHLNYIIVPAKGEEKASGSPEEVVLQLAKQKAMEVAKQYPDHVVVGADTVVCLDGDIMGKPKNKDDAFAMIKKLSGKKHQVLTGVCVYSPTNQDYYVEYDSTDVYFEHLTDEEIAAYVNTDEPFDKAGAYALQGTGGAFVKKIDGCVSNVIGLPMSLLKKMLVKTGVISFYLA